MNITRLCARDNARLRRHDQAQRAQLLFQQGQRFRNFNQHDARRLRIFCRAVEKFDAGFRNLVVTQVFARREFA
ncbi:hypothetical protein D3C86_1825510 [compost metagenome]